MALSASENELANAVNFETEVFEFLKKSTRKTLERATGYSKDYIQEPIAGVSFRVRDGDEAEHVMKKIQPDLLSKGYRAFWSRRREPNGAHIGDEVIVLNSTDHYAILKAKKTMGNEASVSNKALVARLRKWEKGFDFDIVGASGDWVALVFHSLPRNLCAFAEEVYHFCPDSVEQGVGLMTESKNPEFFAEARRLCPQLSEATQKALAKQEKRAASLLKNADPRFAALMAALKNRPSELQEPSTELGIKLLANEIRTKKYLFLWWD